VIVQIEGDRIAATPEPDTGGSFTAYVEGEVAPGKARYIHRGGIETAINVGRRRYREILIELKEPAVGSDRNGPTARRPRGE
jgi:hypothetical protein